MSRGPEIRGLLSELSGWFNESRPLEVVRKLMSEDKEEVLHQVDLMLRYFERYNAKGSPNCKHCKGQGCGRDGRGDPWTCHDCKPDLKGFFK